MAQKNLTKIYKAICTYTGDPIISHYGKYEDLLFRGLHIHFVDLNLLSSRKDFSIINNDSEDYALYQWGSAKQLIDKTRYPCISQRECRQWGGVGIGSAASGGLEVDQQFLGAGEGIIWNDEAFRIVKGGKAFPMEENDQYWWLQVAKFNRVKVLNGVSFSGLWQEFSQYILNKIDIQDCFFMAAFNCQFNKNFFKARSNGILPTDNIDRPPIDIFENDSLIEGGHYLGKNEILDLIIHGPIYVEPLFKIKILTESVELEV
jgi:hypothetical protein